MLGRQGTMAPAADVRSVEVYLEAVRGHFGFLKRTAALDEAFVRSLPLARGEGYLVPVCELHTEDQATIELLSRWREENAFAYPSQFPVTLEGTAAWLRDKLLAVEDRILFLVLDKVGRPIGHLGFANAVNDEMELEIDNVVRGVKEGHPGLMANAMETLLEWARTMIGPKVVSLRVFEDNAHAIAFYQRLGFKEAAKLPLRRHQEGAATFYRTPEPGDAAPPDLHFVRMVYQPAPVPVGQELILTAGPSISARETSYAFDAARHGWNRQWSKYLKALEHRFTEYLGVQHALSTSSCTGALHLALLALGIGPGDEVIVPDLTWVATANAVIYVGATPIFADVDPLSWCLDPASFEAVITPRTKAVIPVHLYGHPAKMDEIVAIARRHGLYIVEDAAPAIGAEFDGQKAGTFGDIAAFSFQGAKLAVTGEGGMLVTNDQALFERVQTIWDQGRDPSRAFWINETGWKYKMSNVQAAIGLGQMERVDELIEMKRRIFGWYAEGLAGTPGISLNFEQPRARSIYWMTSILLDDTVGISRDALIAALRERNVDTRPVFPAISQYPMWPHRPAPQPVARRVGERGINLPSGGHLRREQVEYVCAVLQGILREHPAG